MKLALRLNRATYVRGEVIELFVTATNDGPSSVEVPRLRCRANAQPRFEVVGPAGTTAFDPFAAVRKRPAPPGHPSQLETLAPGAQSRTLVPLAAWVPLTEVGAYTVAASLAWSGGVAQAAPVQFELLPCRGRQASLGSDVDVADERSLVLGAAAHLPPPAGVRLLSRALQPNAYADYSGGPAQALVDAVDLPCTSHEPWANYPREARIERWKVWRSGAALVARPRWGVTASLDVGAARVVPAPLFDRSGRLDVLLTDEDGGPHVRCARFTATGPDAVAVDEPWRAELPRRPLAGRATLAPESLGSARHVVLLIPAASGFDLVHLRIGADAVPHVTRVPVADLHALPGTLALEVSADGAARAACVAGCPDGDGLGWRLSLVEVSVGAGDPTASQRWLPATPRCPVSVAAAFRVDASGAPPAWAAYLGSGAILHGGESVPALAAPPALPLELFAHQRLVHVLGVSPARGPILLPLG